MPNRPAFKEKYDNRYQRRMGGSDWWKVFRKTLTVGR